MIVGENKQLLLQTLTETVYDAVPKQNTEYQYWKYTEVSLPVWLLK